MKIYYFLAHSLVGLFSSFEVHISEDLLGELELIYKICIVV